MSVTSIDRFSLTFLHGPLVLADLLRDTYGGDEKRGIPPVGKIESEYGGGVHGFTHSRIIRCDGAQVAMFATGGASQNGRSYLDVSGVGCQLVRDWPRLVEHSASLPGSRLRRVDIAADFYDGRIKYPDVIAAYQRGLFMRGAGGRQPKSNKIESADPLSEDGRTFYVGRRGNDTYFRAYEKGRKEHSTQFPDWLRMEVELRAAKRVLPWELVAERDQYFTGCYPYLAEVLPEVDPTILVSPQRIASDNLAYKLSWIKGQWGQTLYTAAAAYGGSITDVWDQIVGTTHNQDLIDAGVLLRPGENVLPVAF